MNTSSYNVDIEGDQAQALRAAAPHLVAGETRVPRHLRCIAVSSGKGGVGKTVISIGLSCHLAKLGYKVLILDADLGLANVDLQMGIDPKFTLQDVIFGKCSMESAVVSSKEGVDLLPASSGSQEMVDMGNARHEMFVEELVRFAGGYDFLIIDVAAGIGRNITTFLLAAPEVFVVVANEPTSVMDAYSVIKVLRQHPQSPSIAMVVNMVRTLEEGEKLAVRLNGIVKKFLGDELPVAGVIIYDACVGDAIRARQPLVSYAPNSVPARCLSDVTRFVLSSKDHVRAKARLGRELFGKVAELGRAAAVQQ